MTEKKILQWHDSNVLPELANFEKDQLFVELVRDKYTEPLFRDLFVRAKEGILHEAKGRGAPNRYEFDPFSEKQKKQNGVLISEEREQKWSEGGDVLGRLLIQVRQ